MTVLDTILIIIIIISIISMICMACNNRFQINIIRLNEAEAIIDKTLRKRYDLLNKVVNIIRSETEEDKALDNIKKSRSKKLNMYELDKELNIGMAELKEIIKKYPELKTNEQYSNIAFGLAESESEINAFKKYYDDIAKDYNKMVKSFPSNLLALLCGYKIKQYFNNK